MQRFPPDLQVFLIALTGAAAVLLGLLAPGINWSQWPALVLFILLITIADSLSIDDPRGGAVGAAGTLYYALIFTQSPGGAMLAAGVGVALAVGFTRGWIRWRVITNGSQMALSVGLAGLAYSRLGGIPGVASLDPRGLPAAITAMIVFQVANNGVFAFFYSRVRNVPFLSRWITDFREFLLANVLAIPLAILLAYLYVHVNPLVLLLHLASLPFQRHATQLLISKQALYAQIVEALVVAADVSFPLAKGHAGRVAQLSVAVGREMRMSEPEIQTLQFAAMLHDVGMIGMDELLGRSDLSPDEIARLREHVRIGATIARELPRKDLAAIVLMHHEHYDGTGYPQGLRGERIPLGARILAFAEACETMRDGGVPYGRPYAAADAVRALRDQRGRAFDPEVVDAFLALVARGEIEDTDQVAATAPQLAATPGAAS